MLMKLCPISRLQTKWNLTLDIPRLPIGSNTRAHANKRHANAVFHMSKEALKACLFISEYSKTKTIKKQSTCQY
jgi:hypothetical protein